MRISDWSSDVCSSDLEPAIKSPDDFEPWELSLIPSDFDEWDRCVKTMVARLALMTLHDELTNFIRRHDKIIKKFPIIAATDDIPEKNRSEEHKSELQSLMRISYAVFCLKKKKKL